MLKMNKISKDCPSDQEEERTRAKKNYKKRTIMMRQTFMNM